MTLTSGKIAVDRWTKSVMVTKGRITASLCKATYQDHGQGE